MERTIAQGLSEATGSGTQIIGEIATDRLVPRGVSKSADASARLVVFRELLGLLPERIEEQLAIANRHLEEAAADEQPTIVRGLSPHAPYSVHPELFHRLVGLCREHQAPLAMHLAETRAELELLSHGRGELVEMLSAFGAWRENIIPRSTRILDYLKPLADVECGLIVHGNYLSDEDIGFLAEHPHLSVVYCPRTHAYFGHQNHPWPQTDSSRRAGRVGHRQPRLQPGS